MVAPILSTTARAAVKLAKSRAIVEKGGKPVQKAALIAKGRAKAEKLVPNLAGKKKALPIGTGIAAGVTKIVSDLASEYSGGSPGTRALAKVVKNGQKR